ncbi:hypothetical protein K2Z83_15575 [Oscillochloris sp. ZM17-4]|uniref:hypothetical protein n=1 Tax=Oscillochloris sp. ZM17-4 TaxID=2866714 RepID=UPI001C7306E3|nr:hypothetical protein [Oscillochloris sp. ZM17-4]MBX0329097.1 hypothetical protein [Oscillochloris sp. ZM17-4]
MGGYMLAFGHCISCGAFFSFNPERVPSIRANDAGQPDPAGRREPVCRDCWNRRQAYRRQQGLPEETLLPGAYEPEPEQSEANE